MLATKVLRLIPDLCREFSRLTGWRLEFTLAEHPIPDEDTLNDESGYCWHALIDDGQRPAGILRMAAGDEPLSTYAAATSMAVVLAELLKSLVAERRHVESRDDDVSTLVNLGMAGPVRENLAFLLNQLLRGAVQLTASFSAAFFLLDSTTSLLRLRAVYQVAADEMPQSMRSIVASHIDLRALTEGAQVLTVEQPEANMLPPGIRSALCVAVESETMPIGTLWVYDRREHTYEDRDRHVLQSIAAQLAGVLERVALLRGSESHDRIARDLEAASRVHSVAPFDLPADHRYELASRCASCYELGGDLCEIIPLPEGRVAIAVGDATGNSIPASLIMSAARGALHADPGDHTQVVQTMLRLNRALVAVIDSHQFMSLCYGVFDPDTRQFTYSNAGHPIPLLVRNHTILPLKSHGLLLGVLRDAKYGCATVDLEAGDVLVLYSDGMSEARSHTDEMFRAEGIGDAVLHGIAGSAAAMLESVWNRVDSHIAGGEPGDDRTLVILRVL